MFFFLLLFCFFSFSLSILGVVIEITFAMRLSVLLISYSNLTKGEWAVWDSFVGEIKATPMYINFQPFFLR